MSAGAKECEVLVIGAGPSGAIVTHTLATQGFDVVCLEQGEWVNPSDYPANHPEWELLIQQQWHHDPNVRSLPADYPLEVSDSEMRPVMFNGVGGSTILFGAQWPRLLPSDFRVRSVDGVADDWPLDYEELKPFHDEVDEFIGAAGVDENPAYPEGLAFPMPPHPLGRGGRRAAEAMNRLGWHWWPGTNAIVGYKHKTLEPCGRWGTCEFGCPAGAKASFDLIYMPQALKAGARLQTGARVREVTTDAQGRASGAVWIDREGKEHHQAAKAVVICANGVGTPRLLLMSAAAGHPDGLANSSGLVGRNLMLHPTSSVIGYYEEDLGSWLGPAGELLQSMEFYETRPGNDFVRGAKLVAMPLPGPLNALELQRERGFDAVWGEAFHDLIRGHASGFLWGAVTEDLPSEANRVTLDGALTDSDGLPAAKITYRISEDTRKILRFCNERMQEIHAEMGAAHTVDIPLWIDQPGHLLGTARMGTDPARSVVDANGRAHDVSNLYIADGSIFVTSGAVNPTSTITALALKVARGIVADARKS
ncbi:MAG TPA: GMC family oxidoreductase [Solirubrobacterales bacterium]|nr:GMC family oxidoreductase [Solirubrobacterales bacterium]